MSEISLSKSRLMDQLRCPRRAWLRAHQPEDEQLAESAQLNIATGRRIGEIARQDYPGGIAIAWGDPQQALADTQAALAKGVPVFEAALQAGDLRVYVDLLIPEGNGWHLIEVKAASNAKKHHLQDASIQTWLARQAGLNIVKTSLGLVDKQFSYGGQGNYRGLIRLLDASEHVDKWQTQVPIWLSQTRTCLQGDIPLVEMGSQCKNPFPCGYQSWCRAQGDQPLHPLGEAKPGKAELKRLQARGFRELAQVPPGSFSNEKSQRIHQAVLTGRAVVDPGVKSALQALPYPRYYLDFETLGPAIPIWPGTRPFQLLPFQWSCHIEQADGSVEHRQFLADASTDPSQDCASSLATLFAQLGGGCMLAYAADFEKRVLNVLAERFPQYRMLFRRVCKDTHDLLKITQRYYYHPDMHGSWSIKKVLPTLAPDLSYAGLGIGDGEMAQLAFGKLALGQVGEQEQANIRADLLKYCELDSWGMVRVVRALSYKVSLAEPC